MRVQVGLGWPPSGVSLPLGGLKPTFVPWEGCVAPLVGAGGVFLPLGGMKPIFVPWEGCNVPLMEPPHVVREGVGVGWQSVLNMSPVLCSD